jgi:DNA-binding beta-propeller fold protein YncE
MSARTASIREALASRARDAESRARFAPLARRNLGASLATSRAMRTALLLAVALASASACATPAGGPPRPKKIFIAAQTEARVDVLDGDDLHQLASLETGTMHMPHNVQVTPSGKTVLVTNPRMLMNNETRDDELLVIDPQKDEITARIPIALQAMIAHVVTTPDERTAVITGWGSSALYRVDLASQSLLPETPFADRHPHGLRLSANGTLAYTADSSGAITEVDVASGAIVRDFPLDGAAIQVAVGSAAVYATISDPPGVGRAMLDTGAVTIWRLPDGMHAPAQIALSPDETTLYVAEQGTADAPGDHLLEISALNGAVLATWSVGSGAHGVALTPDGARAYVTGMYDDSLAAIDLSTGLPVMGATSKGPNGLSLWWGIAN